MVGNYVAQIANYLLIMRKEEINIEKFLLFLLV